MTFIETVPEADATGAVHEMYETDRAVFGDLPNLTRAFSLRPEVYGAWRQLNGSIKAGMDLRRYELATLAAARRLRSSYCALAHGSVLMKNAFLTPDALSGLMEEDGTTAGPLAGRSSPSWSSPTRSLTTPRRSVRPTSTNSAPSG